MYDNLVTDFKDVTEHPFINQVAKIAGVVVPTKRQIEKTAKEIFQRFVESYAPVENYQQTRRMQFARAAVEKYLEDMEDLAFPVAGDFVGLFGGLAVYFTTMARQDEPTDDRLERHHNAFFAAVVEVAPDWAPTKETPKPPPKGTATEAPDPKPPPKGTAPPQHTTLARTR